MTDIVIIEDEAIAADHLRRQLAEVVPEGHVVAVLQSIEESVEYFRSVSAVTPLVFMDIHLADGPAFRIFDQVPVDCPIIFTTAYDRYALEAFRVGGIDYLLKPIGIEDLRRAVKRVERQFVTPALSAVPDTGVTTSYRSHFLIPVGNNLVPLEIRQVACFYIEDKITCAVTFDGRHMLIDRPLDAVMLQLNPVRFYRANRQFIVAHDAIDRIAVWPVGKLSLTLKVQVPERIIVSKQKTPEFKKWYTCCG